MQKFTSYYDDKEITFSEDGIRYNNEIFIKYKDMRDISHRTDGKNAIVFRYKDRLVRMPYNPDDKPEIMPYLSKAMQVSRDAEHEEAERRRLDLPTASQNPTINPSDDRFLYLDRVQAMNSMPQQPVVEEPEKKKKSKAGPIIAILVAGIVVAAVLIVIL